MNVYEVLATRADAKNVLERLEGTKGTPLIRPSGQGWTFIHLADEEHARLACERVSREHPVVRVSSAATISVELWIDGAFRAVWSSALYEAEPGTGPGVVSAVGQPLDGIWSAAGCAEADGESLQTLLGPTGLIGELGDAEFFFSRCLPWSTLCEVDPADDEPRDEPPSLYWFDERRGERREADLVSLWLVNTGGGVHHCRVEAFFEDAPVSVKRVEVHGARGARRFEGKDVWTAIPQGLSVPPPSLEATTRASWAPRALEFVVHTASEANRFIIRTFSPAMRRDQAVYDLVHTEGDAFEATLASSPSGS